MQYKIRIWRGSPVIQSGCWTWNLNLELNLLSQLCILQKRIRVDHQRIFLGLSTFFHCYNATKWYPSHKSYKQFRKLLLLLQNWIQNVLSVVKVAESQTAFPNHYPLLFYLKLKAEASVLAHFFEDLTKMKSFTFTIGKFSQI